MILWFSDSKDSYSFLPALVLLGRELCIGVSQTCPCEMQLLKCLTAQNAAEMGIDNTIQSQVGNSESKSMV